jgi:hypothetical protein
VYGRSVILCAQSLESVRIFLNSANRQFQQSHDIKNLFVCDGAGFTSTACQNPTLTIMTLCVRSMDYLLGEMKKGNV